MELVKITRISPSILLQRICFFSCSLNLLYVIFYCFAILNAVLSDVGQQKTEIQLQNNDSQILSTINSVSNLCENKYSCQECIRVSACAWCSLPDFKERCFQKGDPSIERCEEMSYVYNPENVHTILEAKNLTSSKKDETFEETTKNGSTTSSINNEDVVQISPQRISLKLRANEPYKIKFSYQRAEDYPVDLYYLMDLSESMSDDKKTLSELGESLVKEMQKLTKKFQLGFGSFVDKVEMPFSSMVPQIKENPCGYENDLNEKTCAPAYGFRNHMRLSTDANNFKDEVNKAPTSSNLDAPEGGFDAIMQAIVCNKQIGWRDNARHLLVFTTDSSSHFAGDGKLAGIVKPNDGECHLDEETGRDYIYSSKQDYPTVSQINTKVKKMGITLIFAVIETEIYFYKNLTSLIDNSYAEVLNADSSNIVELIKTVYDEITNTVKIKDNTITSPFKITYRSYCLNETGKLEETSTCDKIMVKDKVEFEAEIELKGCPLNKTDWKQLIKIEVEGITESLILEVEMLCDCPCQYPNDRLYETNSPKCNNFGNFTCGLCECPSNRLGRTCECDSNNIISSNDYHISCRANITSDVECSGRGQCVCGECQCYNRKNENEVISGDYCQCDNYSCDRDNGSMCSGNGECVCGKCHCKPGWTGNVCNCKEGTDRCRPFGVSKLCSDHGKCECNSCLCEEGFSGLYCEKCMTCSGRCDELTNCILCGHFNEYEKIHSLSECQNKCREFYFNFTDKVVYNDKIHESQCHGVTKEDCRFEFVYRYDAEGKIFVEAQEVSDCPADAPIVGIIIGVIFAIVVIGLVLLLVWKLITSYKDRIEYAKFEEQRKKAMWNTDHNPLYKQATSTFRNPTFATKSD